MSVELLVAQRAVMDAEDFSAMMRHHWRRITERYGREMLLSRGFLWNVGRDEWQPRGPWVMTQDEARAMKTCRI